MDISIYRLIMLLTLLGFINTLGSQLEAASVFRVHENLVCSMNHPTKQMVFCPSGMQIHIVSAIHGPQRSLAQSGGSLPEGLTPCHQLSSPSSSSVSAKELTLPFCLTAKDVTMPLKQLCEGKSNCDISPDNFAANQTFCRSVPNEMLITYRCEPSPQMVRSLVICQDTYMEIKCTSYGPEESIVVMDAQLVTMVDTNICPAIIETGYCPSQLKVTAGLMALCGSERTCSVMPDTSMLPPGYPSYCARRHLRLAYACVPPSMIESDRRVTGRQSQRQSRPQQHYQKKNRRGQNPVHSARTVGLPSYQQEQRDSGALLNPSNSEFDKSYYPGSMEEGSSFPKLTTQPDVAIPIYTPSNNVAVFPIVLGVLVGLAALILFILLLIVFGFRTHHRRATYAHRKALSDQANTDTTFSEMDKTQQQMQQPKQYQLHFPPTQPIGSPVSYGYQHSSDSGADGGAASTYLPHAVFSTEALWPAGLQSVSLGGNYFEEEAPKVVFPLLGRDSGSHGYVQLPISNSHKSGHVCSHQSSTSTTTNFSANRIRPLAVSHSRAPTEGFPVDLQIRSPGVNCSLSTESDCFSGQPSSHPSSFQPLYPNTSATRLSPLGLGQQECRQITHQQQRWVGYEDGSVTSAEASILPLITRNLQASLSASFESLIEPPENFKNRQTPSGIRLNSVPPRMAQLRRLQKSCDGSEGWRWQEGDCSEQ